MAPARGPYYVAFFKSMYHFHSSGSRGFAARVENRTMFDFFRTAWQIRMGNSGK